MPSTSIIFLPDDRYDRHYASDGQSRFGAYLRQNAPMFVDHFDGSPVSCPLEFAEAAWRVAQSPSMSPAYVTSHARVLMTEPVWDDDGLLGITVSAAAEVPREIARALPVRWRTWHRDTVFGDRSIPDDNTVLYATAQLEIRVPIEAIGLPRPAYIMAGAPDVDVAKQAVAVICARLNSALSGVFAELDRGEGA